MAETEIKKLPIDQQIQHLLKIESANTSAIIQILLGLGQSPAAVKDFYSDIMSEGRLNELINAHLVPGQQLPPTH